MDDQPTIDLPASVDANGVPPPSTGSDASSPRPRFLREKPTHILRWNGDVLEQIIEIDAQYWDAAFGCSYWRTTTEWRAVPRVIPNTQVSNSGPVTHK